MNRPEPGGWARMRAQLHDAARAARQVADATEPAPVAPSITTVPRPRPEAPLMPAGPGPGQQPHRLVRTLTAPQLPEYRRDLEHAAKHLPDYAPVRDLLRRQLAEIRTEQDARAQSASPPSADTSQ